MYLCEVFNVSVVGANLSKVVVPPQMRSADSYIVFFPLSVRNSIAFYLAGPIVLSVFEYLTYSDR